MTKGTVSDKLRDLAERCEKATGPDAYLDLEIFKAATDISWRDIAELTDAPSYTASLDAAMTLFPDGYFPVLDADPRSIEVEVQYLTDATDNGLGACGATGGKTIALALCAAALRARAEKAQ